MSEEKGCYNCKWLKGTGISRVYKNGKIPRGMECESNYWESKQDVVNHPDHYKTGGIETIDFIEAKELDFYLGNVVKYVSRSAHKGKELEDLKKAQWYLNRKIERLEGGK